MANLVLRASLAISSYKTQFYGTCIITHLLTCERAHWLKKKTRGTSGTRNMDTFSVQSQPNSLLLVNKKENSNAPFGSDLCV